MKKVCIFYANIDLLNILKQRTEDVDVKKHAVEYLYKIGSMKYTYDMENIYQNQTILATQLVLKNWNKLNINLEKNTKLSYLKIITFKEACSQI